MKEHASEAQNLSCMKSWTEWHRYEKLILPGSGQIGTNVTAKQVGSMPFNPRFHAKYIMNI